MSYTYTWTCKKILKKQSGGISYENLIQLIILAKKLDAAYKVEKQKNRLIRPGVGAKPKLLVEDQIVLTLIYLPRYFSSIRLDFSRK